MDTEALKTVLADLHGESFVWALNCCHGEREDAADVLQTVYLKILQGRARYDGRSPLKVWLFSVIRRTAAEFYRKRSGYRRVLQRYAEEAEHQLAAPEVSDSDGRAGVVTQAMQRLSPRQRAILQLVFYHKLTVEAAARVMDVGVGSARRHYARAKENLRRELEKMGWRHVVETG